MVRRASWREDALLEAAELEALLLWVKQRTPEPIATVAQMSEQIDRHLRAARQAASTNTFFATSDLVHRIRGNLDAAQTLILRVAPEPYLRGQMRLLTGEVRRLPLGDPRRTVIEEVVRRPRGEELTEADRSAVISAIRATNEEAQRDLIRIRSFDSILGLAALLTTVMAITLAVVGTMSPSLIPMCFAPGDAIVCPTRSAFISFEAPDTDDVLRATASQFDLAIVELCGVVAAGVAAAVGLRNFRGVSLPHNPMIRLVLIKLPLGALTSVIGLLLIQGGFIPGFLALDSSAQILGWALVFGLAQQLFTRLLDRRALDLVEKVESPVTYSSTGLDPLTAEAFTTAVSSTLKQSAPEAFRELISGQPLVNYAGAVSLQVLESTGTRVESSGARQITLAGGRRYTLRVIIGPKAREGFAMPLRVTNGIEEDTVRWTVELDSNDRGLRQPEQALILGTASGESQVDFPLQFDDQLQQRWLWVRVSQREQVVLQAELDVVVS